MLGGFDEITYVNFLAQRLGLYSSHTGSPWSNLQTAFPTVHNGCLLKELTKNEGTGSLKFNALFLTLTLRSLQLFLHFVPAKTISTVIHVFSNTTVMYKGHWFREITMTRTCEALLKTLYRSNPFDSHHYYSSLLLKLPPYLLVICCKRVSVLSAVILGGRILHHFT